MKDRNGKTLRKGDVCVVHNSGSRLYHGDWFGAIFIVSKFLNESEYPFCIKGKRYEISGSQNPASSDARHLPEELEIIGDVR